jgi:putative FmdB family regulatory protein
MPLYEYRCEACDEPFEEFLFSSTASPPPCPACGSAEVERRFSSSFGTKWRPSIVNWHRVGSKWGTPPPKKVF